MLDRRTLPGPGRASAAAEPAVFPARGPRRHRRDRRQSGLTLGWRPARWATLAVVLAGLALARPGHASCRASRGPCMSPEAAGFFLGEPQVVLTNFGLLLPGAAAAPGWELVCDDNYGLPPTKQVRRAPDGQLFAASYAGLYRSRDGCTWTLAGGALGATSLLFDVAFDHQDASRVWALADLPRGLFLSTDGGVTFTLRQRFSDVEPFTRLVVAPSDGQRLYLSGPRGSRGTPTAVSLDGGATFTSFDLTERAVSLPRTSLELVDVSPQDPGLLFWSVIDRAGDEIWRSDDGGASVAPVLKLAQGDAFGGLAFGAGGTVYVGGADLLFAEPNGPAGRLYRSPDGGRTWEAPRPAGVKGPRFRCLVASGGLLYACGAGEAVGDAFMVGVSADEGLTWSPVARLGEISGARACVQAICRPSEVWLCDIYNQCAPGLVPGGFRDAGPAAADACSGATCDGGSGGEADGGGCSCAIGGGARPAGPLALTLLALLLARPLAALLRLPRRRRPVHPRR